MYQSITDLESEWTRIDGPIARQVTAVVIGAGLRGTKYAYFALDFPSRLKIVGVAEPKPHRMETMKRMHSIPDHLAVLKLPSRLYRKLEVTRCCLILPIYIHK